MKTLLSILLPLAEIEYQLIHIVETLIQKIGKTKKHSVLIEFQTELMICCYLLICFAILNIKIYPLENIVKPIQVQTAKMED